MVEKCLKTVCGINMRLSNHGSQTYRLQARLFSRNTPPNVSKNIVRYYSKVLGHHGYNLYTNVIYLYSLQHNYVNVLPAQSERHQQVQSLAFTSNISPGHTEITLQIYIVFIKLVKPYLTVFGFSRTLYLLLVK